MKYWFCIIRAKEAPPPWRGKSAAASRPSRACRLDCARSRPSAATTQRLDPAVPDEGPPYATHEDLVQCCGLILGSPTRFRQHGGARQIFLDGTSALWISGALAGKPAGVFTSTQTLHGGQESTLLSMMVPLLHHGMYLVGLPFTEAALSDTRSGGTPYGASHVAALERPGELSEHESALARALGTRVAFLADRLAART